MSAPPCRHLLFILDWRSTDEIIFGILRETLVQQCMNLFHVFQIASQYDKKHFIPLVVSLKLLLRNSVEVLLHRVEPSAPSVTQSSPIHSLVNQTFLELLQKPCDIIPPSDSLRSSLPHRLQPLSLAVTHTHTVPGTGGTKSSSAGTSSSSGKPHHKEVLEGDTLVFISSSFLSYADLFTSLSFLARLAEEKVPPIRGAPPLTFSHSAAHESITEGGPTYRIHCLGVDSEAACITMAEFNGNSLSEKEVDKTEGNGSTMSTPTQRLYRSAGDPCDIRFAIQSSLSPFLLGETNTTAVQINLGGHFQLFGLARRPYVVDMRRCCLPEDLREAQEGWRQGLCFLGQNIGSSPFDIARQHHSGTRNTTVVKSGGHGHGGALTSRGSHGNGSFLPQLHLQALLHPEMIEETYLFGDPWVLSPSPNDSIWESVFDVFQNDVLLLRTNEPVLQSAHHFAFPQASFIAFFKDKWHIILRQVIPTELRREIITRGDQAVCGGKRGRVESDPALLQELHALRSHVRGENQSLSANSMNALLSCGLGIMASQMTMEPGSSLCITRSR